MKLKKQDKTKQKNKQTYKKKRINDSENLTSIYRFQCFSTSRSCLIGLKPKIHSLTFVSQQMRDKMLRLMCNKCWTVYHAFEPNKKISKRSTTFNMFNGVFWTFNITWYTVFNMNSLNNSQNICYSGNVEINEYHRLYSLNDYSGTWFMDS